MSFGLAITNAFFLFVTYYWVSRVMSIASVPLKDVLLALHFR
jgi:hypothetical protein